MAAGNEDESKQSLKANQWRFSLKIKMKEDYKKESGRPLKTMKGMDINRWVGTWTSASEDKLVADSYIIFFLFVSVCTQFGTHAARVNSN